MVEEDHEGASWCEETKYQINLKKEDTHNDETWHGKVIEETWVDKADSEISYNDELECEKISSQHSWEYEDMNVAETWEEDEPERGDMETTPAEQTSYDYTNQADSWEHSTDSEGESESHHICFSGHSQGPEAYLRWERDMDNWFQSNQVPEEEKTSYAEDTLTEDAFRHWEQDAYARLEYVVPESSWKEMKQLLQKEFMEDAATNQQYYSKIYTNPERRRWILATTSSPKAKPKKAYCPKQKKVSPHVLKENPEAKEPAVVKSVLEDRTQQKLIRDFAKKTTLLPNDVNKQSWRGVIASLLIKEKPPDAQHRPHPSNPQVLNRGNKVLRIKLLQEGGYDAVIKPAAAPKFNQTGCTMLNKPEKDICLLFEAYQLNHDDSQLENILNSIKSVIKEESDQKE
ncbi:unnamed protein product [Arabis nemorensis]|uniref:Uncharacterized protein n=1 Tax=Arabis nemorensis TaxID=586526 RepID=A0A565BM94_9BRAS|nr:unnamed protein product [Arabis nemorensis]